MISIIVCSRNKLLSEAFVKNIADTIDVDYEIVHIDNSENQYSISSAYNKGIIESKYSYLCFVHEDVKFHSHGWGKNIIEHLQRPNAGVFGLAGRDFVTRVPASWKVKLDSVNIIQSYQTERKRSKTRFLPKKFNSPCRSVVLLDGVFMCMRRELMDTIRFDESIDGFHGYDFDICIQFAIAGYSNFVMYDIVLEHYSKGHSDACYYHNLIKIFRKWNHKLPLIGENTPIKQLSRIGRIEEKGLRRLLVKMVRRGFSTKEIIDEITFFGSSIGSSRVKFIRQSIYLHVFFIRLFNCPKYLLK